MEQAEHERQRARHGEAAALVGVRALLDAERVYGQLRLLPRLLDAEREALGGMIGAKVQALAKHDRVHPLLAVLRPDVGRRCVPGAPELAVVYARERGHDGLGARSGQQQSSSHGKG